MVSLDGQAAVSLGGNQCFLFWQIFTTWQKNNSVRFYFF
jgi:hypothetical protein